MPSRPPTLGAIAGLLAAVGFLSGCGGEQETADFENEPRLLQQAYTCAVGCGGALGSAALPGPHGAVTLTAWSNSPQLGTDYDCDPTRCAGSSPVTAQNGYLSYGCPWQCVELVNRYFQGTWGAPKIAANAGAGFCQFAASSSLPQYWVYGQYGASTSGHAPMAGDVLVWSSHVAIATNSVSAGAAGTIDLIEENATCSGADTVSWNGSMFGAKYGLSALCWVHLMANTGATGPTCPTGGNWHLAGKYCGSEPGMQHADGNTLYSCSAAGGAASVVQVCSAGCQQMPAGQDDRCASPQVADAGVGIDAGVDAGTQPDAGADAGTPAASNDPPPPAALSAGCTSGGAAWTSCIALVGLSVSRRRQRRCAR